MVLRKLVVSGDSRWLVGSEGRLHRFAELSLEASSLASALHETAG